MLPAAAPQILGVKSFFFAYFAFVGIFSPYLSLYFAARGVGIVEIAVLLALPLMMRIVAPVFWGWLADRGQSRVWLLRLSAGLALAVVLAFPLADSVRGFGVLILLLFFMTSAHMPIAESMALAISGADQGRYGRIRVWGSVGFIATVLAGGPLLDVLGLQALPWLMALAMALVLAVSWRLPESVRPPRIRPDSPIHTRMREPAVAAFFASAFLMVFAHAALYSFFSLYLHDLGYSKSAIGLMWAVGVVAEIALFSGQRVLFERVGVMGLLGFSFLVCALRFVLIGVGAGLVWVLVVAQLMHAVTFGLHHSACMAILGRWFEPQQQARAQAVFVMVAYGFGGSIGGLTAGWIWENISPSATFLVAAAVALVGFSAVRLSARSPLRQPSRAGLGGGPAGGER